MKNDLKNLPFAEDFIFCAVLIERPDLLHELLEIILQRELPKFTYISNQETLKFSPDGKDIRLDVYVEDDQAVYDVEMQNAMSNNLARRSRYYSSKTSVRDLGKGENYNSLRDNYVIFICKEDAMGRSLPIYTYRYNCEEDGKSLNDGSTIIFLSASLYEKVENERLKAFLKLVYENTASDFFTDDILKTVAEVKQSRKVEGTYMTWTEKLEASKNAGIVEGANQERVKSINSLTKTMNVSVSEAMNLLQIPTEEQEELIKAINSKA